MQDSPFTSLRKKLLALYDEGEARAITLLVAEDAFGMSRTDVYMGKDRDFSAEQCERLANLSERLIKGEPVQYVLGKAWFCGRLFDVDSSVLVPRPETEELVEWTKSIAEKDYEKGGEHLRILDVGTGSGCIAITLKQLLPLADVWAMDISGSALRIARSNAERQGVSVHFIHHDMEKTLPPDVPTLDIIVSNPPYIMDKEQGEMRRNVLDYEPHTALFVPDDDPLRFYRALCKMSETHLRPGGYLMLEINRALGKETVDLLKSHGFEQVELRNDAFGNLRMVGGRKA